MIITPENPDANKIRSGAKVALRSKCNSHLWLDCTSPNIFGSCSITTYTSTSNNARRHASIFCGPTNASITTCDRHYFKIFGVGRRLNRLINTNHSIHLRHQYYDSYLNCNTGDICILSECADNCEPPSFKFNILS